MILLELLHQIYIMAEDLNTVEEFSRQKWFQSYALCYVVITSGTHFNLISHKKYV